MQRSEVEGIVGTNAFQYGFFTGHEDFGLCTDPTADICVTYAHRSIEEFFGSLGFLQALDDGQSVDEILGSDCEKLIFMVNPLVFQFCLWLRAEFFGSRRIVYDKLAACVAQQIDVHVLDIDNVDEMFPAMGIRKAVRDKDSLKLEFFKQVFEKCEQVRVFQIRRYKTRYWTDNEHLALGTDILGVMGLISHNLLNKLSLLSISEDFVLHDLNSNAFTVSLELREYVSYEVISKILLTNSDVLERAPQVRAKIYWKDSLDLKILMQKHIKELHVSNSSRAPLSISGELPFSPHFTHFTVYGFHIDDSVPSTFMKAVKEGKLPNLRRIELNSCTMNDCEWPEVPEFSCKLWGMTMSDLSQMQGQLLKLTELTVGEDKDEPLQLDRLIPVPLENLSVFRLYLKATELQCLNDVLKQDLLPNLSKMFVSCLTLRREIRRDTFLPEFDPNHTGRLEKIALWEFNISVEGLEILSEKLTAVQLTKLDLYYSYGLTGNLSALFTHSLPTLNTLKLKLCDLNANDLQSLARANVEGKLPQLRHLDISSNEDVIISDLFTHSFPRLNSLILWGCGLNANDLQSLARTNAEGKLPQLRHLDIADENRYKNSDLFTHSAQWNQLKTLGTADRNILNIGPKFLISLEELCLTWLLGLPHVTRCWSGLKTIKLDCEDGLPCIDDGVERGMFPDLTTVRCYEFDPEELSLFKLFKANIFIHTEEL